MTEKRMKLVGPPGTGKTTRLAKWARNLAQKYGNAGLMVCSMTRTAAAEIGGRETGVPKENVGTLHAICFRNMEKSTIWKPETHAQEFNEMFPGYDLATSSSPEPGAEKTWGDELMVMLELHRARRSSEDSMSNELREFNTKYQAFKNANGIIDFTDMIEIGLSNIDSPFSFIIADEAQDYSRLEFDLLKKWGEQSEGIVIAGDADQSLYGFRGASVEEFIQFSDKRTVLDQSYRVPEAVWEYSETLTGRMVVHEERVYRPRECRGSVEVADGIRSAEDIASLLHDLGRLPDANAREDMESTDGDLQRPTSMILFSCGYMTVPVAAALKARGIPYHNPYRREREYSTLWNPLEWGGKKKITAADRVRAFLDPPWTWRQTFMWMSIMRDLPRGTKKELTEKKQQTGVVPLDWFRERIGSDGLSACAMGDMDWWLDRVLKTKQSVLYYPIRVVRRYGQKALTRAPNIILGTIHSVKGGEADNVIVSPDLSYKFTQEWRYRSPDPLLRMFFVAATRSRENLYLLPHMNDKNRAFKWYG